MSLSQAPDHGTSMPIKDPEQRRQYYRAYCRQKRERFLEWHRQELGQEYRPTWKLEWSKGRKRRSLMEHLDKGRAQQAVNRSVRSGRLVRPEVCSSCGETPPRNNAGRTAIHGHHEDYSKPLEVVWLCRRCHVAVHKRPSPNPGS